MRAAFEGAILSAGSVRAESAKAPDEPHSELQVPTSPGLGPRKPRHQNAKPELVGCELIGRRCWGRPKRHGEIAHDFRCLGHGDGGDGGIRTLDRALQPYNGLANRRLQPLGHVSNSVDMPDAGACRKRQIQG
jgi:hypothetical protein